MNCCKNKNKIEKMNKKGFISGIVYGIIPHSFCILFIIFSIIGATIFSTYIKKILFLPYFFPMLILLSLFFATLSGYFYLKKNKLLSKQGLAKSRNYLIVLYSTTIAVNILFIYIIFPLFNNYYFQKTSVVSANQNSVDQILVLEVQIPCSGHASLIDNELRKNNGISKVQFKNPDIFQISYNKNIISESQIMALDLFKEFKATKQ